MKNRNFSLFFLFLLVGGLPYLQGQELDRILDYTVSETGKMTIIFEGEVDPESKEIKGFIQSYDQKSVPQYEMFYRLNIDKVEADSLYDFEAYALSVNKHHTLFYGHLHHAESYPIYFVANKRGQIKKEFCEKVDFQKVLEQVETTDFRSYCYFWMIANQGALHLAPYFGQSKVLSAQVFMRDLAKAQKKVSFDSFIIESSDSTSLITYRDDIQIKWEHEISGIINTEKDSEFKLTETDEYFYFYLYRDTKDGNKPVIYIIEKQTGLVRSQIAPDRFRA